MKGIKTLNYEQAKRYIIKNSNLDNEKGFLYLLKNNYVINTEYFIEIMESLENVVNDLYYKELNGEILKCIYTIIFWCRSWLSKDGMLDKRLTCSQKEKLINYTEILEETLYYLLLGNKEEAFWRYNEYLDGR